MSKDDYVYDKNLANEVLGLLVYEFIFSGIILVFILFNYYKNVWAQSFAELKEYKGKLKLYHHKSSKNDVDS